MNGQREGVGRAGEMEDHTRGEGFPGGSASKESAHNVGDLDWIHETGKRNDNSLQYSCLENPMDRGAWQATVHES